MIIDWGCYHDFEKNTDYQKRQLFNDFISCSLPKEYQNLEFLKSTLNYMVKQYGKMTQTTTKLVFEQPQPQTDSKSTSKYIRKSDVDRERVKSLIIDGKNNSEISRITGFDRRTIANIRKELN